MVLKVYYDMTMNPHCTNYTGGPKEKGTEEISLFGLMFI